ncbi:hypothetical protein LAZ67_3001825, partial [Cordylochernes scorpioides]
MIIMVGRSRRLSFTPGCKFCRTGRPLAAIPTANAAAQVRRNWADITEEVNPGAEEGFTLVQGRKRRRGSANSPTAAAPSSNAGGSRTIRRPQPSAGSVPRAQEIRVTRAHIAEARARQASSSEEHCVYIELSPELEPFHYLRALDRMLGGTAGVIQITKVNGHQLLGLTNRGLAERLISEGLEVEGTLLRAFPFRKRAERITVGNLPFFIGDSAVINALSPYGRVTSIAPRQMKAGLYVYVDGRRDVFITLHEGITIERLPTRLDINIKGEAWPAYLSSGIRCSRCHGQGHRRAICPLLAGLANNTRMAPPTTPAGVPPPTTPASPQRSAAQPPAPTPSIPAMDVCGAPPMARAALHSSAPRPSPTAAPAFPMKETPPAPPPVTPAPSLRTPGSREPAAPTPDVEMSIVEETFASSTSSAKNATRVDLDAFIEGHPSVSFAKSDALGLGREEVLDLLSSRTKAQRKGPLLSPPQCDALSRPDRANPGPETRSSQQPVQSPRTINKVCFHSFTCLHMVQAMIILVGNMPNSASPGSPGSAGQMPGRPSIQSPTGGKISKKNEYQKVISKENSEHQDWGDSEMAEMDANEGYTTVRTKKRRRVSPGSPAAAAPSSGTRGAGATRRPRSSTGWAPRAEEVRTTRAHIAEARARQASSTEDHCVYIERSPEMEPYHYMRALDIMLGGTREVFQMTKMNGHFLVGLANRGLAERLVNEGLEVEGTLHRAFPFRKRAERITVGNLPFFVVDAAVISALSTFGRVTSIAPKLMKAGPYVYNDGRREAFIILREGMTIERLPTRLDISIKGEAWPAYLSSGIRCSRCRGQGHRRANCPMLAGRTTAPGTGTPTSPTSAPPATAPRLPQQPSAQPPSPASPSSTMEVSDVPPASRAAPLPPAALQPSPPAPSALPAEDAPPAPPPVIPAPSLRTPGSREPAAPTPDVEMSIVEETSASSASSAKNATRIDLDAFIERHPSVSFAGTDALGLGREEVLDLLSSRTKAQRKGPLLSPPQCDALAGLIGQILNLRPGAASNLYKVLGQVKDELRPTSAAVPTPPLPAPRPSEPVPLTSHGKQLSPALRTPPLPAPAEMEEDVPMTEEERCAPPPPAPRLAGPIPPVPHGDTTTLAMATPPPPLSTQMDRALMDKRWEALRDLMHELDREFELDLEHRFQSRVDVDDIIRAILYPGDREPLIKRLPTRDRYTLGGLMSTAIRRARELDPFILECMSSEIPIVLRKNQNYVNPPAGSQDANSAAPIDLSLSLAAIPTSNAAAQVRRNWADITEEVNPGAEEGFTLVQGRKRRRGSANSPTAAAPSSNAGGSRTIRRPQPSAGSVPQAQEIRVTIAHIAEARARQASSSEEHCVYIEHSPELEPFHYLRALDRMLGGTAGVIQITKVNGHQLLGLTNRGLAERLISEGLEVEGTLLRAFPFRKREERITVGNLPFFVRDSAVINALSPYGRVTSITPKQMKAGPYVYVDGRRDIFITPHEGITIERLPTRLDINIKGEAWPADLSSGIRCSRCHGQGHRRAICPLLAGLANNTRMAPPTTPAGVPPLTTPAPPQRSAAQPPAPAPSNPAMEVCSAPPVARAVLHPSAPRPSPPAAPALPMEETPSAPPPVTPAPYLRVPEGPVGPRPAISQNPEPPPARPDFVAPRDPLPAQKTLGPVAPTPDVEMSIVEETSASSTSSAKNATRVDLDAFIEKHPSVSFVGTGALGLGREEVLDLLSSRTKAQRKGPLLSPPQCDAFAGLIGQILDLRPGAASNLYKVLGQVKAELRTTPTAVSPIPPLPAPRPAEPTPPAPHGKMTTPAMATSPSTLFQVEEDLTSKRWDEAADIIYKLSNERYSGPMTDLGITEGDIADAVIYPEDREPLLRTCSTQKKNLITEIISAAIERARDSDPFVQVRENETDLYSGGQDSHVGEAKLFCCLDESHSLVSHLQQDFTDGGQFVLTALEQSPVAVNQTECTAAADSCAAVDH